MRLALHILWFIASLAVATYGGLYIEIAREFGIKHDYIVPIILLVLSIASAVASIYLYVR